MRFNRPRSASAVAWMLALVAALGVALPGHAFEKPKAAFVVSKKHEIQAAPAQKATRSNQSLHPAMMDALSGKRTRTSRTALSGLSKPSRVEPQRYQLKSTYQRKGLTKLEPVGMPTAGITHHWIAPLPEANHNYLQDMYKP